MKYLILITCFLLIFCSCLHNRSEYERAAFGKIVYDPKIIKEVIDVNYTRCCPDEMNTKYLSPVYEYYNSYPLDKDIVYRAWNTTLKTFEARHVKPYKVYTHYIKWTCTNKGFPKESDYMKESMPYCAQTIVVLGKESNGAYTVLDYSGIDLLCSTMPQE